MKTLKTNCGELLLIGMLLFFCGSAKASHNMGVDLTYSHISGNTYEVTLSYYRDCSGISPSSSRIISINSLSGCGLSSSINLTLQSSTEVSPICPNDIINSSCNGGTLQGVEVYIYTGNITLPNACTDWIISFTDCCRNNSISNIASSSGSSTYVEALINNLDAPGNNSPVFTIPPVPYLCTNQNFSYSHGVLDVDGDSLAYTLINPKQSSSSQIAYNAGFSHLQPVSTTGAFVFNLLTGQISFTPDLVQTSVMAVLVEEYRNGVLIGSTIRDMQIVILGCSNAQPIPSSVSNLSGGQIVGNEITTCAGNVLSFTIVCTDSDINDVISISTNVQAVLPGAVVTVNNGNPATIQVSWTVSSFANTGFFVEFKDGVCPIEGRISESYVIKPVSVRFGVSDTMKCPNDLSKQVQAIAGIGNYSWSPAALFSDPNISNPVVDVSNTPLQVQVTYSDGNGCVTSNILHINERPMQLDFSPNISWVDFCTGDQPVSLSASLNGDVGQFSSPTYNVNSVLFAPLPLPNSTAVSLGDDAVSTALPIGFGFNFWGNIYSDFYIASNGFITFNASSGSGCCSGQQLPSTTAPNNLIAFAWEDLDPGNGGQPASNLIRYQTLGISPNRVLVMEFFNVNHFPSGNNITMQVHLYETSNSIQIHTTAQPDVTGSHTMGIEDLNGTNGITVSGRNRSSWTATNEAFEFSPQAGASIFAHQYTWAPSVGINQTNVSSIVATPVLPTLYTCTADDGICQATKSIFIGCNLLALDCAYFESNLVGASIVELNWGIQHAVDGIGFYVERSIDGIEFERVGFVPKYSSPSNDYTFVDASAAPGTQYYYRLYYEAADLSVEYPCSMVAIQTEGSQLTSLQIQPNPSTTRATLSFHAFQYGQYKIALKNILGKELIDYGLYAINKGSNQIPIGLGSLASGTYFIEVSSCDKTHKKLLKLIKV